MTSENDSGTPLALPYEVKLEHFEGPLDLLLHLVRKHELDIFDIPIAFITEKYLEYLDMMKALNLDIAGEFLYYAALLAHIKSRQMLPPDEDEGAGEEEGPDPAQELQERLLAYQQFKEAAEQLGDRPQVGRAVWLRGSELDAGEELEPALPPFADVSLFKLVDAMAKVLARAKPETFHDVVVDRISIADRINELLDLFKETSRITFVQTFDHLELGPAFRIEVVATFLAILEMARQRLIRLHQPAGSDEIYLERVVQALELDPPDVNIDDSYD